MSKFYSELFGAFVYDPSTGVVTRKIRMGNYQKGTVCNSLTTNKHYYKVCYKGVQYLLHRLAWYLHYGTEPPEQVDHINLDPFDNSAANLRVANMSTNQMNIAVHTRSQTGIKGIMPVRGGSLYRAEVCVDGKRYQKHSKDVEVLRSWVESKRSELHGNYARN